MKERSDGSPGSAFWFSFPYRPDETTVDVVYDINSRDSSRLVSRRTSVNQSRRTSLLPQQSQQSSTVKITKFQGKEMRVSCKGIPLFKILLSDDTQSILKVVGRMLKTNGHPIETAVNGSQALERMKSSYVDNDIDVLLTDLQMPVMDGIECTKRFRAWEEEQQCLLDAQGVPRRPRFLIIGMSANSDTQSKQEALDAGMDNFVSKPFNYQDFETIIRTHCKYTITNYVQLKFKIHSNSLTFVSLLLNMTGMKTTAAVNPTVSTPAM